MEIATIIKKGCPPQMNIPKKQWPEQPLEGLKIRFAGEEINMDEKEFTIDKMNIKFQDAVDRIPARIVTFIYNRYNKAIHDMRSAFTVISGRYGLLEARYGRLVHEKNNAEANAIQVAIIADYYKDRCEKIEALSKAIDVKRLSPEEYARYVEWQMLRGSQLPVVERAEIED